jgi:2-amino-4-hydroxy-6-hydroxymethyldihydropteridine diphosphokinase
MNQVIIALGSNIDPEKNIRLTKEILGQTYNLLAESSFKKTSPVDTPPQADFINGAVLIETTLEKAELRNNLKHIESRLGRAAQHDPNTPRTIDLDIVVWNKRVVDPDFYKRAYLKRCVLELIPDLNIS